MKKEKDLPIVEFEELRREMKTEPSYKSLFFDRHGQPISAKEWSKLLEDYAYRVIKQHHVGDDVFISTVYLGLNHNFGGGEPLIFETMVFVKDGVDGQKNGEMYRYATEDEARAGHSRLLKQYRRAYRLAGGQDYKYEEVVSEILSQTCEKCGLARTVKGVCDHSWGEVEKNWGNDSDDVGTFFYQTCKRCGLINFISKT